FLSGTLHPRALHSFPTRRSSDLIDQFLMHGKSVIFLTPGNDVSMVDGFSSGPTNNDYESLLEFYGLGVSKNVLAESQNWEQLRLDRKSTRLNSSHQIISYAVFCL